MHVEATSLILAARAGHVDRGLIISLLLRLVQVAAARSSSDLKRIRLYYTSVAYGAIFPIMFEL